MTIQSTDTKEIRPAGQPQAPGGGDGIAPAQAAAAPAPDAVSGDAPAVSDAAAGTAVAATDAGRPMDGEIHETVDPFDYAEAIVRDLALHVGTRLRDFRTDLMAMHNAIVQLPEQMRLPALGQSIQELRERVAHLAGVVSQQASRPPEEPERLVRAVNDLLQRVHGLEGWVAAAARRAAAGGEEEEDVVPLLPSAGTGGGLVSLDQFDRAVDQLHQSILRVVGAVRDMQLDIRDLRNGAVAPAVGAAGPAVMTQAPAIDAAALERRLESLGSRLDAQATRLQGLVERLDSQEDTVAALAEQVTAPPPPPPPPLPLPPVVVPVAAPARAPVAALEPVTEPTFSPSDVATLIFAAWPRLSQPQGAEALTRTVEETLAHLATRLDDSVRTPQVAKGSGLVALCTGERPRGLVVALLAVEDLCAQGWELSADGGRLNSTEHPSSPPRYPVWRSLLNAAAMVEQTRPGSIAVPVVIYGNGWLDRVPGEDEVAAYGEYVGAPEAAARLVTVGAGDLHLPGLGTPSDAGAAIAALDE
ncbi:hypothetical protein [Rhodospirillum centenum]|uniref:Uncharacterized protein n=1 Tax=Rhodospirillum centenum (strain ATCC 51521 / SW) TaxID=414684 RepID=B6IWP2_RHOCS|nr:hypothetical protein [Rhodospirillum centenum]ACJ00716.1 hypothetical protein RC1_3356 [Rhodospirillum centenum SW]